MSILMKDYFLHLATLGILTGMALMITTGAAAPVGISPGAYPSLKSYLGTPLPPALARNALPETQGTAMAVFSPPIIDRASFFVPVFPTPNPGLFQQRVSIPDSSMYAPFANLTGPGSGSDFPDISPSGSAFLFEEYSPSGSLEPFEDVSDSGSSAVFEEISPSGSTHAWEEISPSGNPFGWHIQRQECIGHPSHGDRKLRM